MYYRWPEAAEYQLHSEIDYVYGTGGAERMEECFLRHYGLEEPSEPAMNRQFILVLASAALVAAGIALWRRASHSRC